MRLIDADALKIEMSHKCEFECGCCKQFDSKRDSCRVIDMAPTIDTIQHGHWIIRDDHGVYTVCSRCLCYTQHGNDDDEENNRLYITSDYCPNCGAIMDEVGT